MWQQSLLRGGTDLSQDLAKSVENSEQLKSEFIDSWSPVNWILFGILCSHIQNHWRVFWVFCCCCFWGFFPTLPQLCLFKISFFHNKSLKMHNNSQLNLSFKCWMMLCILQIQRQRCERNFLLITPDRKNLGMCRQVVSVLQFSKGIRYRNGTEHSKANYVGFYFPMPCICVQMIETANIMKSNSWRIMWKTHSQPTL